MRIGSLFSGYGGLDIAVQAVYGGEVAWYSEIEPAACRVLAAHHPGVPNLGDITVVDWAAVPPVDVLTGGYPCQPFSHAGKRKGTNDERHLWPHVRDAIRVLRPRLTVLENVRGHLTLGFDTVLADLAELGMSARWGVVRASDAGAPHGRARIFITAYPQGGRRGAWSGPAEDAARREGARTGDGGGPAADALSQRHHGVGAEQPAASTQRRRADAARSAEPAAHPDGAGRGEHGGAVATKPQLAATQHPGDAPAHPDRDGHGRELHAGGMGGLESGSKGGAQQRQRARGIADAGGAGAAADAQHDGSDWRKVRRGTSASAAEGRLRELEGRHPTTAWGRYAPAIARWERVLGRPAPAPTVPGRTGRPRLNPQFVEWMMGLPAGHVTGHGLSAAQELKMLGNGVVPQQAALALRMLGVAS